MGIARGHIRATGILTSCLEREMVCDFERRRQKPSAENFLHRGGRLADSLERSGQRRPRRWKRKQAERRLSHDAEHAFRSDKQSNQVKTRLVLMNAPTEPQNVATGQHDLQTQNIVTSDAVFDAARSSGVAGYISANSAVIHAG